VLVIIAERKLTVKVFILISKGICECEMQSKSGACQKPFRFSKDHELFDRLSTLLVTGSSHMAIQKTALVVESCGCFDDLFGCFLCCAVIVIHVYINVNESA